MPVPTETPYGPALEVTHWLRVNDIDPCDVPIEGPITIEHEGTEGTLYIRYAALLRKDGRPYVDEATGEAARELRTVPLRVEPPEKVQVKAI